MDWKEQQRLREDIQQCFLNPDLSIIKNKRDYAKKETNVKFDDIVLCPFCLMSYELNKFALRKGLRICPCCGLQLKLSTLGNIDNLDRFVKFIFDYRFNGFWEKICLDILAKDRNTRFNEWNKRLYGLGFGFGKEFWDNYKRMKGE